MSAEPLMSAGETPVILLVAEAVTLAHFARILSLAAALPAQEYRVVVAADPRYAGLAPELAVPLEPIRSIPGAAFSQALARGKPLYDATTLAAYAEEDLALIDRVRPDLIVGDFRLSLAISAPLTRVPCASVVNAYWSPYADLRYPVPDLPVTRLLGIGLGQRLFDLVRPLAFALHARPLNRARRCFGLPALGHDLRRAYAWGDHVLYADVPEVIPTHDLPPNHRYLGPVLWSARTDLPPWWHELPRDRPIVCVTLGSSGRADLLPRVLQALAQLPVTIVAASLGQPLPACPANVFVADYLPLEEVLGDAALLVCNGGSLSTYQAMAAGVPSLGLCANLDQLLNMEAVARLGCGLALRAARFDADGLRAAARGLLEAPQARRAAAHMAAVLQGYDAGQRFRVAVRQILG